MTIFILQSDYIFSGGVGLYTVLLTITRWTPVETILVPVWPNSLLYRDFLFIEITKGEKSLYETRDPMMSGSFAIYSPYPLEYLLRNCKLF